MPGKDRRKWPPWLAKDKQEDFTPITRSVRKSPAYRSLTGNQKDLLLLCWILGNPKARGRKVRLPRDDFPDVEIFQPDQVFYMCLATAVNDGLYDSKNKRYYGDMEALKEHGFIKCLAKGGRGSMSIYKLVDDWKNMKNGE